jgi:hypothetical protein
MALDVGSGHFLGDEICDGADNPQDGGDARNPRTIRRLDRRHSN